MTIYFNSLYYNLGDKTKNFWNENPDVDLLALPEHAQ